MFFIVRIACIPPYWYKVCPLMSIWKHCDFSRTPVPPSMYVVYLRNLTLVQIYPSLLYLLTFLSDTSYLDVYNLSAWFYVFPTTSSTSYKFTSTAGVHHLWHRVLPSPRRHLVRAPVHVYRARRHQRLLVLQDLRGCSQDHQELHVARPRRVGLASRVEYVE